MKILVVEDEPVLLRQLTRRVHEALPEAEIVAFDNADDALAALPSGVIDIAFLDIAIGTVTGVDLAGCVKDAYPRCDIVFTTGYSEYAPKAFEMGASDYLMKPVTAEKIEHALSQLRHNSLKENMGKGLFIRCFGNFEVYYDGEPVVSITKRSKELLAYLINKAGVLCPVAEICNAIFRDSTDSYIRVVKKDLIKTLSDMGEEGILIKGWGVLGIDRKNVRCDYFDYLDGKPGSLNLYHGVYMSQYDWAQAHNLLKTGKKD